MTALPQPVVNIRIGFVLFEAADMTALTENFQINRKNGAMSSLLASVASQTTEMKCVSLAVRITQYSVHHSKLHSILIYNDTT